MSDQVTYRYINGRIVPLYAWNSDREFKKKDKWYEELKAAEPEITSHCKALAKDSGTELFGLDFRLKGKDSYDEKYERKSKEQDRPYKANDVVRYTFLTKETDYVSKYDEIVNKFKESGYNVVEVENHWLNPRNPYNGINMVFSSPNKQPFEVQFHFKESQRIKDLQHPLYDMQKTAKRNGDQKLIEEYDYQLHALSKELKAPKNIEKVRNYP